MKKNNMYSKWKIFRETLLLVLIILAIKAVLHHFSLSVIELSPFNSIIISGSVFVLGFILSSTHTDYKECEKIPIEISTAIESIYQDGVMFKRDYKDFDFQELKNILSQITILLKEDVIHHTKKSFFKAKELTQVFSKLEKLQVPISYVIRLKQDQNAIMRAVLRINYIQKIQPIPSAFILVECIVVGLILLLMLTKMNSLVDELIAIGFITFIFIYMLKLINVLEKPFQLEGSTMDDISLSLLEEQEKRIQHDTI